MKLVLGKTNSCYAEKVIGIFSTEIYNKSINNRNFVQDKIKDSKNVALTAALNNKTMIVCDDEILFSQKTTRTVAKKISENAIFSEVFR